MMRIRPWLAPLAIALLIPPWQAHVSPARAGGPPPAVTLAGTCPRERVRNGALGVALPLPAGWAEATPTMAPPGEIFLFSPGYEGSSRLLIDSLGATSDPDPAHAASTAVDRLSRGITLPITRTPIVVAGVLGILVRGLPGQAANVQIVLARARGLYRIILFGDAALTPVGRAILGSIAFIPRTAPFPGPVSPSMSSPGPFPSLLALTVGASPNDSGVRVMASGQGYRPGQSVALHLCWQGVPYPTLRAVPTYDTLDRTARADARGALTVALTIPVAPAGYSSYTVRLDARDARIGNLLRTASGLVGSGRPGPGPASCPTTYRDVPNPTPGVGVAIDWIDFAHLNGIDYVAPALPRGRALTPSDLGPRVATVCFQVADHVEVPTYRVRDGDAAFLAPGTPVYAVKGYRPTFRVATPREGRIVLFEVDTNPRARTGADLLDIAGKVCAIGVNGEDAATQLGAITDPRHIATLIGLILAAPVDQQRTDQNGVRYFIAFHLMDGTTVTRAYWPDSGELARGIMAPPAFRSAVERVARR